MTSKPKIYKFSGEWDDIRCIVSIGPDKDGHIIKRFISLKPFALAYDAYRLNHQILEGGQVTILITFKNDELVLDFDGYEDNYECITNVQSLKFLN